MKEHRFPNPLVDVRRPQHDAVADFNPTGFVWRPVEGATSYELKVGPDPALTSQETRTYTVTKGLCQFLSHMRKVVLIGHARLVQLSHDATADLCLLHGVIQFAKHRSGLKSFQQHRTQFAVVVDQAIDTVSVPDSQGSCFRVDVSLKTNLDHDLATIGHRRVAHVVGLDLLGSRPELEIPFFDAPLKNVGQSGNHSGPPRRPRA